jgi:hypothetical protein
MPSDATRKCSLRFSDPVRQLVIDDYPLGGSRRGKAHFWIEPKPGKGERACRETENRAGGWSKPKKTTFANRTLIVTGDDGKTYILRDVGSFIDVMKWNLQFTAGNFFPGDDGYDEVKALFDEKTGENT